VKRSLRSILFLALTVASLGSAKPAVAASSPSNCAPDGRQESGAVYRICMPASVPWNHEVVIYAHGYVAFNEPIAIPEDQLALPGGPSFVEMINSLGYAFATTSYSTNGLAIQQGLHDVVDLTNIFASLYGEPTRTYIAGPSEGGTVTALAIERYPEIFDGGLSACGPIGDFQSQINYWGDVRATFDYYFPNVLPGSAIAIPTEVIEQWESVYEPRVRSQLRNNPLKLLQWTTVADIPLNALSPEDTIDALTQLLWYSVFATNDGVEKLNGQPYENSERIYRGSLDDAVLNYHVGRYSADQSALEEIQSLYKTSGNVARPLVTIHTTDPLIPLWHQGLYSLKASKLQSDVNVAPITFAGRYGHCNFSAAQILVSFIILVDGVTHTIPANAEIALAADQREEFQALMAEQFPPAATNGPRLFLPSVQGLGSN
jgi:hypothetical protein